MALCLAAAGSRVFISGRRPEMLAATIDLMMLPGDPKPDCEPIPLDLNDPSEIAKACRRVSDLCLHGLDGLINNAAQPEQVASRPLLSAGIPYWDERFAVNLRAPWLLSRTMAPIMAATGRIRIINMTSTAGWAGTAGFGIYNVTKAALNSLTLSLAEELAAAFEGVDVQINAVDPGQAHTEMNQGSWESPDSILPLILKLLSSPSGGPNGKFFHKDGRSLSFGFSAPYDKEL